MRKAKIILASLAILAVVGGTLAFKARSFLPPNVYTLLAGNKVASITIGSMVYTTTVQNCTLLPLRSTSQGGVLANVSSTTISPNSTTVFRSGAFFIIAPYTYCTLWVTKVMDDDTD
jgi:hypothetical protein